MVGMIKQNITVVVNCFNRREFVVEALKSVYAQSIPKSDYEIILIKNFHDPEVDEYAENHEIKSILTHDVTTGSWFDIAAKNASGDFIAFLDDDDLMHPNKLEIIQSVIGLDSEIVYIHNKSEITNSAFKDMEFDRDKITYFQLDDRSKFRKSLKNKYYFNLSSITIRRDIFREYMPFIRNTNHGTDVVMFATACMSGKKMVEYNEFLTFFRIHSDSHGNFKAKSIEELETVKMNVLPSYIYNWQLISESQNRKPLQEYARLRELTTKIWLNLVSPRLIYRINFSEILENIRGIIMYPLFVPFIAVYCFDRLFHEASRKIYNIVIYSWVGWRLRENI